MQLVTPRLTSQLQRLTTTQAFTDLAYYIPQADTTTLDDYGQPSASTSFIPVSCSFTDKPSIERWTGGEDIQQIDAEIRFTTPQPNKGGKIKISRQFSGIVTERTYEIVGIQSRGAFGYVCALKAVSI